MSDDEGHAYVSRRHCGSCRKTYVQLWRSRNPEKHRAHNKNYYARHSTAVLARMRSNVVKGWLVKTPKLTDDVERIVKAVIKKWSLDHGRYFDDLTGAAWEILLTSPVKYKRWLGSNRRNSKRMAWLYTTLRKEAGRIRFGYLPKNFTGNKPVEFVEFDESYLGSTGDGIDLICARDLAYKMAKTCYQRDPRYASTFRFMLEDIPHDEGAKKLGCTLRVYKDYRSQVRAILRDQFLNEQQQKRAA